MAEPLDSKQVQKVKAMVRSNSLKIKTLIELLVEKGIILEEEFSEKHEEMKSRHLESKPLTHAEQIIRAVAHLVKHQGKLIFSRKDVRDQIGLNQKQWASGYDAIFQSMRADHPVASPPIGYRLWVRLCQNCPRAICAHGVWNTAHRGV